MRNETVYCKVCGKKLAWWDMFTNIQYEDEYECQGKFRKKLVDVWISKDGKTTTHGGKKPPSPGAKPLKSEMNYCSLYYHTKYCKSCVRKIKGKCVRPRCKGKIRLTHRKDGSLTKYAHGGW